MHLEWEPCGNAVEMEPDQRPGDDVIEQLVNEDQADGWPGAAHQN